jgi:DNA helicase-2/ATP-dependent DNA helicase PcrA
VYNSPGWRRLQSRSQNRPAPPAPKQKSDIIDLSAVNSFTIGDRVFHQKFGYGKVAVIDKDKLENDLEKADLKKVVARLITGVDDIPF